MARIMTVLLLFVVTAAAADTSQLDDWFDRYDYAAIAEWLESQEGASEPSVDVLYWQARLEVANGRGAEALEMIDQALEREPGQARLHTLRGQALTVEINEADGMRQQMRLGRQMRKAFETAVELEPDYVPARRGLFNYYLAAPRIAGGGKKKARRQVEALARISPADGAVAEATMHARDEDLESALEALERALSLDADHPEARFLAGLHYTENEQWGPARESFRVLTEKVPLNNNVWYQLGRVAALSGESLDEGRQALETYLAREHRYGTPSPAAAHWRLGMIHAAAGDLEGARAEYERSLELDPEFEDARESLDQLQEAMPES